MEKITISNFSTLVSIYGFPAVLARTNECDISQCLLELIKNTDDNKLFLQCLTYLELNGNNLVDLCQIVILQNNTARFCKCIKLLEQLYYSFKGQNREDILRIYLVTGIKLVDFGIYYKCYFESDLIKLVDHKILAARAIGKQIYEQVAVATMFHTYDSINNYLN